MEPPQEEDSSGSDDREEGGEVGSEVDAEVKDENSGSPLGYYSWAEVPSDVSTVRLSTQFVIDGMATFDLNIYQ
ncbi:MAG TPA: hypothetical protein DDW87_08200 [Firmicutes bacterium]|nr:hypothetical protein [Bacillota bacterium]